MVRHGRADEDGQSVRSKLQELEKSHHRGPSRQAVSTAMPLLSRCFCFSLLTGAVLTGIYATAVYIVAFAMEVWLITEATDPLPSPPYILCVVYFITWTMSVALLVGLALRRTQPILGWLLSVIITFFPECGLVMFMSLYYWTLGTSFGTVELVFWIVRASMNILGTIQIFSLYSKWKEEKNVSRRLRDLSMHASPMSNGYYTNAVIKTPLPGSLRAGYHNAAYISSNMNLRQMHPLGNRQPLNSTLMSADPGRHFVRDSLKRSVSSLSHYYPDENDGGKGYFKEDILNGFSAFDRWQQHHQRIDPSKMEPGMAFGSMGIAGVGLDDPELGMMDDVHDGCPQRSMWFMDDEDYLNRAPLSRAVSTLVLNNYSTNFSGPSFDRQSQFVTSCNAPHVRAPAMRRAHSMNDINLRPSRISPDIKFGRMDRQPFDYVRSAAQNGRTLARGESDEFQRSYKDVAL